LDVWQESSWWPLRRSKQNAEGRRPTCHRLEADHVNESIHHLSERLCDNSRLSNHHHFPPHALFPAAAPTLHRRYPRRGLAAVVDVGLGALQDLGPELDGEGCESCLNVGVEGVEEEAGDEEEEDGEEGEGAELEVSTIAKISGVALER
jgi:hypothetical protein